MLTHETARRLKEIRLSCVPGGVGIVATGWVFYTVYFWATGRGWSMRLCLIEAILTLLLVAVAQSRPKTREFISHLNVLFVLCGVVAEGVGSGGLLSCSPAFLACLGVLAAHQMGMRGALAWTLLSIVGLAVAFWEFDSVPMYRTPTKFDKMIMFGGLSAILYLLSRRIEQSFEQQVSQLIYYAGGLQEQTRLLRLSEKTAGIGHWNLDLASGSFLASLEARKICGIESGEEHVTVDEFVRNLSADDRLRLSAAISRASETPQEFHIHLEFVDEDEHVRYVTCCGFSEQRDDGKVHMVFGVLKDETEAHQAEIALVATATLDSLTQLPNRRQFQQHMTDVLQYAEETSTQVSALILDLNGFKEINDTLGHSFGDRVINMIAERLKKVAAEHFVARLGGDEFVIVQRDAPSLSAVSILGEQLARAVNHPIVIAGRHLNVSASVGAAIYPRDAKDRDELLAFADTAMYQAKKAGESFRHYESSMTTDLVRRHETENRLATALAADEFYLVYQPQVTIGSQEIIGFEALVRWKRDGQMIPPSEFIPLLEQSGRIIEVGRWILLEACCQAQAWAQAGYDVDMSVNISPVQFCDSNFVASVLEVIEQSGLAPERLDLELTESVLAADVNLIAAKLDVLKTTGNKISIDDFGTGYSSLAYLKHFPIDRLKIDRAFVKDYPTEDDGIIARSIITMADSLEMIVLAEGVETETQLAFLREHGCDQYQGYLFNKPLAAHEAEALMEELRSGVGLSNPFLMPELAGPQ